MKSNILKLLASALLASFFVACGDSDSSSTSSNDANEAVADSVAIRDSINLIDSVRYIDSVRITDSLNIIDSVRYKTVKKYLDSLRITDSLNIIDSVVTRVLDSINIIDSIRVIDSINIIDSIHITEKFNVLDSFNIMDSLEIHTLEDFLGACNESTKGVIKKTFINEAHRYYCCDNQTLLWRIATEQEIIGTINSRYVTQSAVSDFIPVERVFKGLADDERLVVILRHAERKDGSGTDIELTNPGRSQSQEVGAKLENGLVDFYYAGSEYLYTHQTYYNIALRRFDAYTEGDTMEVLNEKWFVKNQTSYYKALDDEEDVGRNVTTRWAYKGGYDDAFYDLKTRSSELLEDYLIPALEESGRRVGVFISHDLVLIPLVSYVSEGRINLKYYESPENHWLNYLAGIAVVLKPDGTKVFYAVKGLDSGTMTLPIE